MRDNVLGLIVFLCAAIALAGCEESDNVGTVQSNDWEFKKVCVDGVVYLYRGGAYEGLFAPKWNPDGTVETCTE